MDTSDRRQHLNLVVDHLIAVHRAWQESDAPYITEEFEAVVDELIDTYKHGDLPADCRESAALVQQMAESWQTWKFAAAINPDGNPSPKAASPFWKHLELVVESRQARIQRPRRTLEPISELTAQKVPDSQICRIYGWVHLDNSPDFDTLREERTTPGTHTGPDFVPPLERERLKIEAEQQASYRRLQTKQAHKLAALDGPAPCAESLEDLVRQGVSAQQIAKMLCSTVDDVYGQCQEAGLPLPAESYGRPETFTGQFDQEPNESAKRIKQAGRQAPPSQLPEMQPLPADAAVDVDGEPFEPTTVEDEILQLHKQMPEMNTRQLAEALNREDCPVNWQKVAAVLRAAEEPAGEAA